MEEPLPSSGWPIGVSREVKPNAELGLEPGAIPETFTFIWQHEYFYFIFKKVKSICINIISATEDTDLNQLSFKIPPKERCRVVFYTCIHIKLYAAEKLRYCTEGEAESKSSRKKNRKSVKINVIYLQNCVGSWPRRSSRNRGPHRRDGRHRWGRHCDRCWCGGSAGGQPRPPPCSAPQPPPVKGPTSASSEPSPEISRTSIRITTLSYINRVAINET